MIIKGIDVYNKKVRMKDVTIDITKKGIYKICGEVGSGKTSLLEEIIFGHNEISTENREEEEAYLQCRYKLFSYVPQNSYPLDMKVYDYIVRGNNEIDEKEIYFYFERFYLEEGLLERKFSELSGGERVKVVIITELIKDTPYIFMDEPTNHLDNASVEALKIILDELQKCKVIVLVSHDKRLNVKEVGRYVVKDNHVQYVLCKQEGESEENAATSKVKIKRISLFATIRPLIKNFAHYVSVCFLVMGLAFLSVYNHFECETDYNKEELPKSDFIFVSLNGNFEEINERYAKAEKLSVDEEKYDTQMTMQDVKEVSAMEGIEEVYIKDVDYLDELQGRLYSEDKEKMLLFSCPAKIFNELWKYSSIDLGFSFLYGEFPDDGENEVMLSLETLHRFFGDEVASEKDAIGKVIDIGDGTKTESYEVVGIIDSDVIVLSYDRQQKYGFHYYDEQTFSSFLERQEKYYVENDAGECLVDEMLILVKNNKEKKVLNELIEEYPANQYYSRAFVKEWGTSYNNDRFIEMLIANTVVSVIVSIISFVVNRNSIKYNYNTIKNYENYFIDKKRIRRSFRRMCICQYCLIVAVFLVLNAGWCAYHRVENTLLCIDSCLILLPQLWLHYIFGRRKIEG